jgi:hypothetical protein
LVESLILVVSGDPGWLAQPGADSGDNNRSPALGPDAHRLRLAAIEVEPGGALDGDFADVVAVAINRDAAAHGAPEIELVTSVRRECLLGIPAGRDAMDLVIARFARLVVTRTIDGVGSRCTGNEQRKGDDRESVVMAFHLVDELQGRV